MSQYVICRDIRGKRHFLSYRQKTRDVFWLVEDALDSWPSVKVIVYKEEETAKDRAKRFAINAYVLPVNI